MNLFSILSPRLDPFQAGQSMTEGFHQMQTSNAQAEAKRSALANETEQHRSNVTREGLAQQGMDLQKDQFGWGKSKDQVGLFGQYLELMNSGDVAGAEQLASSMKAMGIDLRPDDGPGQPFHEWSASASQAPSAPVAQPTAGQGVGPDPAAKLEQQRQLGKQIDQKSDEIIGALGQPLPLRNGAQIQPPPMLTKFMEGQTPSPQETAAPEDAAARVAAIGGDATGMGAPPPEIPPLQSRGTLQPPQQPSGPLPRIRVSFDGRDMGVVDPNARVAQERKYVEQESGAFTDLFPDRYKKMMGNVGRAQNRSQLKTLEGAASGVFEQMMAGERAQAQARAMGMRAGVTEDRTAYAAAMAQIKDEVSLTKDLRKRTESIAQQMKLAGSKNSFAERMAVALNTKSMFSAATSDRELLYATSAGGKLLDFERKLNEWTEGGRLPDDFVRQMNEASAVMSEAVGEVLREKGATFVDNIMGNPQIVESLGPERARQLAEIGYSRITGVGGTPKWTGKKDPGNSVSVQSTESSRGTDPMTGAPTGKTYPEPSTVVHLPGNEPKRVPGKLPNAPDL